MFGLLIFSDFLLQELKKWIKKILNKIQSNWSYIFITFQLLKKKKKWGKERDQNLSMRIFDNMFGNNCWILSDLLEICIKGIAKFE